MADTLPVVRVTICSPIAPGAAHARPASASAPQCTSTILAAGDRLARRLAGRRAAVLPPRGGGVAGASAPRASSAGSTSAQDLPTSEPSLRDAALAYFCVAPEGGGERRALDALSAWCALGRDVARALAQAGADLLRRPPAPLGRRAAAPTRLQRVGASGSVCTAMHGWHGEFLAQAYFAAAPRALRVLRAEDVRRLGRRWASALQPTLQGDAVLRRAAARLRHLQAGRSASAFFARRAGARRASTPRPAVAFYRSCRPRCAACTAAARRAAARLPAAERRWRQPLAEIVAGRRCAGARRARAQVPRRALDLAHDGGARRFPAASSRCCARCRGLRRSAPAAVREWFARGLRDRRENADAGLAYFALESRTSLQGAARLVDGRGARRRRRACCASTFRC